jgi:hypothetical protein
MIGFAKSLLCLAGLHDWTEWGWQAWHRWGLEPPFSEKRLCKRDGCLAQDDRYLDAYGRVVEWKIKETK